MKKACAVLLILVLLCSMGIHAIANEAGLAQAVVLEYFDCLDQNAWQDLQQLLCDEEQQEFALFISDTNNAEQNIGYYNYVSADLVSIELSESANLSEIDPNKQANYTDFKCWECIIDVVAYTNTRFLKTGYNRFWVYTGCDADGNYRIAEVLRDSNYFDVNVDVNEIISPLSYDAPVSPNGYGQWTLPETIIVRNYGEVNFLQYCYTVTTSEFGTDSYQEEARKAVAQCVKQYGWLRTLRQKYPGYGYDVKENTSDQVYNPSVVPTEKVIAAVDAIWNYVMLSCDKKLFCSFHTRDYNSNSNAVANGGVLSQLGANSLSMNGFTWIGILQFYFDYGTYNIEVTPGSISVVDLNHEATGQPELASGDLHNHYCACTVCGWTHYAPHTWYYDGTVYECIECGKRSNYIPLQPFFVVSDEEEVV